MKVIRLFILFSLVSISAASTDICDRLSWNVQVGLAPTLWGGRDQFSAVSCNVVDVLQLSNPLVALFKFPQFNKLFHVPVIIGSYMSYETDCDLHLFAQFDYRRAKARAFTIPNLVIPQVDTISFSFIPQDHYQAVDAFIGLWNESPFRCINANYFFGAKVGLVHRFNVNATFVTSSLEVPFENETNARRIINNNTSIAIGGVGGLNGCLYNRLLWCLQFEIVAACGPHIINNIAYDYSTESVLINPVLAPTNFINKSIQTEIYFPITIGFRYLL